MNDYTYTDDNYEVLSIHTTLPGDAAVVDVSDGAVRIPTAEAPVVAAALLKAAGSKHTILEPAYGDIEEQGDIVTCGSGPEYTEANVGSNPRWLRNRAANDIALAEYIEAHTQRVTETEQRRQERREELLSELNAGALWDHTSELAQKAIDRIIALEDGQANR